jgi:hypothetical protein
MARESAKHLNRETTGMGVEEVMVDHPDVYIQRQIISCHSREIVAGPQLKIK